MPASSRGEVRLPMWLYLQSASLVAYVKTVSQRDEIAYFGWCYFQRSRDGHAPRRRVKRRITHGGTSVLISPPREAISLWGQRRGLPIIQGQGGGNAEG